MMNAAAALMLMRNSKNKQNNRINSNRRSHSIPSTYVRMQTNHELLVSTPQYKKYITYLQNNNCQITHLEYEIQCAVTKNIKGGDEISRIEKLGRKLVAAKQEYEDTYSEFKQFESSEMKYYAQIYGEDDEDDDYR